MKQFLVSWIVDVEEEGIDTPEKAAQHVWNTYFQNGKDLIANVFTVREPKTKTITTIDLSELIDPNEEIYKKMDQYLSIYNEENEYDAIISVLKKALKDNPNGLIDYLQYQLNGGIEFIPVWEKVRERFTVEEFCDLVGIK